MAGDVPDLDAGSVIRPDEGERRLDEMSRRRDDARRFAFGDCGGRDGLRFGRRGVLPAHEPGQFRRRLASESEVVRVYARERGTRTAADELVVVDAEDGDLGGDLKFQLLAGRDRVGGDEVGRAEHRGGTGDGLEEIGKSRLPRFAHGDPVAPELVAESREAARGPGGRGFGRDERVGAEGPLGAQVAGGEDADGAVVVL